MNSGRSKAGRICVRFFVGKKTKAKKLVPPGGTSEKNRDGASFISFLKKPICAIGV